MTIIQLEYLLAVANCGSFSLAAEHCFVTQPSLSMQIKSLEEELGVVLLDRSKKPVIATEAGEVVLERARETLRAYENIRESVAELKGEVAGRLRLGVIPTIAPYLLHKFLPGFVRDYPHVELEVKELMTRDIVEAMKHDRIDAALVAGGTCGEGIQEQELFDDRFFVYVSPENPLYERSNTSDDNTVLIHITYEVNAGKVYTGSVDVPFHRTLDDDQSWVNVERNHLYTVVLGNGLPVGGTAQASLLVDEWNTVSMEEPMTEP